MRIEVDVELDEFDTEYLIDELKDRYNHKSYKSEIEKFCRKILNIENTIPKGSLLDELKINLIENNIHKFTLDELEVFFKSK